MAQCKLGSAYMSCKKPLTDLRIFVSIVCRSFFMLSFESSESFPTAFTPATTWCPKLLWCGRLPFHKTCCIRGLSCASSCFNSEDLQQVQCQTNLFVVKVSRFTAFSCASFSIRGISHVTSGKCACGQDSHDEANLNNNIRGRSVGGCCWHRYFRIGFHARW